jgi:flagellar motor switch protein FliN/FliY
MSTPLTSDALQRAAIRELPGACGAVLGGTASVTDAPGAPGDGWIVTVPLSGAATGHLMVWIDGVSATACARRVLADDAEPADDAVAGVLGNLLGRLASVVEQTPEGAGLIAGEPASRKAAAPHGAEVVAIAFDDGVAATFRVHADLDASAAEPHPLTDSRLEAVLEVDLPLVVRFGRAIMPLRSIADLSPGAVVDMGRTPDEPVELLVGERLVARGEVVIVGGNYGVRITELTSGRRASDLEVRA